MGKTRRPFSQKWRWQRVTKLMARDGTNCAICDEPLDRHVRELNHDRYVTFDHILPRSAGGLDDLSNLRLAHRYCNTKRGNDPILPEEEAASAAAV